MKKNESALKFKSDDAFSHFCVRLIEENVPFSLSGDKTVIVRGKFPPQLQGGLDTMADVGLVEILPQVLPVKRKLPPPHEADTILDDLIKNFSCL